MSSVDPDSESSGIRNGIRRKQTPDIVSDEDAKTKQERKVTKSKDKKNVKTEMKKGNPKAKAGQKKISKDKREGISKKEVRKQVPMYSSMVRPQNYMMMR